MRFLFSNANGRLGHFIDVIKSHYLLLVVPMLAFGFLAGVYGLVKSDVYTAHQSLLIRDDLMGDSMKGRFDTQESLKSAQDTILEIARGPELISNALQRVGKPSSLLGFLGGGDYPSESTIESVQGKITIGAPNGGEPGKTDIFNLSVKESSRDRAGKFIEFLLEELEAKIRDVRGSRLQSMVLELEQKVELCKAAFDKSSDSLKELEKELGPDLGAIRSMSVEIPNESSFTRQLQQIENEKRIAFDDLENARQQLNLINRAMEQPASIPPTTSELLGMQPTLVAKFNDLAEAQKTLAIDRGKYQPSHYKILGDLETIDDLVSKIKVDLETAAVGLKSQVESLEALYQRRSARHHELEQRLIRLAELRVEYEQLNNEVKSRQAVYDEAYGNLVEVKSLLQSAEKGDILTRVKPAQVATTPDGLGTKAMVMAASFGGFLFGCGLLVLIAPPYSEGESVPRPTPNRDPSPTQQDIPTTRPVTADSTNLSSLPNSVVPNQNQGSTAPVMMASSVQLKAQTDGGTEHKQASADPARPSATEAIVAEGNEAVAMESKEKVEEGLGQRDPKILSHSQTNLSQTTANDPENTESVKEAGAVQETNARDLAFESPDGDAAPNTGVATSDIFASLSASFAEQVQKPDDTPSSPTEGAKKSDSLKTVLDGLKEGNSTDKAENSDAGESVDKAKDDNILADLKESLSQAAQTAEKKRAEAMARPAESSLLDAPFESAAPPRALADNEVVEQAVASNSNDKNLHQPSSADSRVTPVRKREGDATIMVSEDELSAAGRPDAGDVRHEKGVGPAAENSEPIVPQKRLSVRPIDLIKGRNSTRSPRRMTATQAAEDLVKQLRAEKSETDEKNRESEVAAEEPPSPENSISAAQPLRPQTSELGDADRSPKERLFTAKADIESVTSDSVAKATLPIPDQVATLEGAEFCVPSCQESVESADS